MASDENSPAIFRNVRKSLGPLARKSLGTPARRLSLGVNNCVELSPKCAVPENDDEAERRERQRKRVQELQRNNLSSPATPTNKRQSIGSGIAGLTNAQLAEHYANCMKLSAENKITVKNAFGLHLIDYMADMLKKTDGSTNFQMASCTLDASAKIYAYRVDCVHADVFKMAGGLGIAEEQKKDDSHIEDDGNNVKNKDKRKKATKKSRTVEQNLKNLNFNKLETGFEADALFLKMSKAFDEGGVNGLLFNTFTRNDSCELLLDASVLHHSENKVQELSWIPYPQQLTDILHQLTDEETLICPSLSKFSFLDCNNIINQSVEDGLPPAKKSALAFDLNSVPEPYEVDATSQNDDDDSVNNDNEAFPEAEALPESCANSSLTEHATFAEVRDACITSAKQTGVKAVRLESIQDLTKVLAEEPSEYSYFDHNLIAAWAGPNHWRLRPFSKYKLSEQGEIVRKTVKKPPFKLDYENENNLSKHFTPGSRTIKLMKKTLQQWDEDKTTLPVDLHYDPKKLTQLFKKTLFIVPLAKSVTEVDGDVGEYNYDNANDRENFCPDIGNEIDYDGSGDVDLFPSTMDFTCEATRSQSALSTGSVNSDVAQLLASQAFCGENLVQQPYKVSKIEIQYAKTAKKIDVKKLKHVMWQVLISCSEENKENVGDQEPVSKMSGKMKFSDLYNVLPEKLSNSMAKNLSVPIAFVCFLHMVNEKTLNLLNQEDLADFTIMQG